MRWGWNIQMETAGGKGCGGVRWAEAWAAAQVETVEREAWRLRHEHF